MNKNYDYFEANVSKEILETIEQHDLEEYEKLKLNNHVCTDCRYLWAMLGLRCTNRKAIEKHKYEGGLCFITSCDFFSHNDLKINPEETINLAEIIKQNKNLNALDGFLSKKKSRNKVLLNLKLIFKKLINKLKEVKWKNSKK
jgi:hypothetical protein